MLLCMAVPPSPQPPPPRHTKGEHRIVVRRCRIGGSLAFGLVRVAAHVRVSTLHACMVVTGALVMFRSAHLLVLGTLLSCFTWRHQNIRGGQLASTCTSVLTAAIIMNTFVLQH